MVILKRVGLIVVLGFLLLMNMGTSCNPKTGDIYVFGWWVGNIYFDVPGKLFSMELKADNDMTFGFGNPAQYSKPGTWMQDGQVFTGQVPAMDKNFTGTFSSDGKKLTGKVKTSGREYDFDATKQP